MKNLLVILAIASMALISCGCADNNPTPLGPSELAKAEFTHFTKGDWALFNQDWIHKGNVLISNENGAVLKSKPAQGAQLQYLKPFMQKTFQIDAKAENWAQDTSIGAEYWDGPTHYGIVFTRGHLGVINKSLSGKNEDYQRIEDWEKIKSQFCTFRFVWTKDKLVLYVNGVKGASYNGPLIPARELFIRLNSSNDRIDQLNVKRFVIFKS